jgi:glutamate-1-semialdehyde 2,1-aminomutase
LSVFGKAVANGFPLGVIGGRKNIMQLFDAVEPDKRVLIAGTYNAHPINAAAAIATLQILRDTNVYSHINKMCQKLYSNLEKMFQEKGSQMVLARNESAFCPYFCERLPQDTHDILMNHNFDFDLKFRKALIGKGIYFIPIACKQGSVSYAHTEEDIDKTLEAMWGVLKGM